MLEPRCQHQMVIEKKWPLTHQNQTSQILKHHDADPHLKWIPQNSVGVLNVNNSQWQLLQWLGDWFFFNKKNPWFFREKNTWTKICQHLSSSTFFFLRCYFSISTISLPASSAVDFRPVSSCLGTWHPHWIERHHIHMIWKMNKTLCLITFHEKRNMLGMKCLFWLAFDNQSSTMVRTCISCLDLKQCSCCVGQLVLETGQQHVQTALVSREFSAVQAANLSAKYWQTSAILSLPCIKSIAAIACTILLVAVC